MEGLVSIVAQFGPLWALVFVLAFLLWHFGSKWFDMLAASKEGHAEIEAKREERKRQEMTARIEHDREMAEIKGQMATTMQESNTPMAALKALMESVVTSNQVLHDDLQASKAGSLQMQSDMKDVKQKVDIIYAKEV